MERKRENGLRQKDLQLQYFSPLKIFIPFSWETFGALFFLAFFNTLSFLVLSLLAPSILGMTKRFWKYFRRKQTSKFLWMGWKWLHHEYKIWGVAGISTVNAYSRMDLCTQIFLDESRNKILRREENWFDKISKLKKNTSLNKAQLEQKLLYG
jgi:hypothetical protein